MNGSNSNTSGTTVATVSSMPKGILERFIETLGSLRENLRKVILGDATLAQVDFAPKSTNGSDKISNERMEEIARRLVITFESAAAGNVVLSPEPPEDKSKVWWQTDPISNVPIGSPKVWNSTQNAWVAVQAVASPYVPPQKRYTTVFAPQGQSQQTAKFDDIGTTDYEVNITPTTYINGGWLPGPSTFPTHFGFIVVGKSNTECVISLFGTPEDGAMFEIDITERVRS
jgi:hypothetical protein